MLIDLPWPLRGLEKSTAFQAEDANTTPSSSNVVPEGQFDTRTRGGVRSGISKRYTEQLDGFPTFLVAADSETRASGEPVRYLVAGHTNGFARSLSTRSTTSSLLTSLKAYYKLSNHVDSGTSGLHLTTNGTITTSAGILGDCLEQNATAANYYSQSSDFNLGNSDNWSISVWFRPASIASNEAIWGAGLARYTTVAMGNPLQGEWTWGLLNTGVLKFNYVEDDVNNTLYSFSGTFVVDTWYHAVITHSSTGTLTAYLNGAVNTLSGPSGGVGANWGDVKLEIGRIFTASNLTFDGKIDEFGFWDKVLTPCEVEELYNFGFAQTHPFRVDSASYTDQLQELAGPLTDENGQFITDEFGEFITVAAYQVGFQRRGSAASIGDTVLVADNGDVVIFGDGIVGASNTLTSAAVASWSSEGVEVGDHHVVITAATGSSVQSGTYPVTSLSSGTLTFDPTSGLAGTGLTSLTTGACTFSVEKAPKVIDAEAGTVNVLAATTGSVPSGTTLVAVYRDRAVWVKDRDWFMSRQGNIYDYNYGADEGDLGRAVSGEASDAGKPGEPIIALAPGGDDYLVMFGDDTTWVIRGDPASGGELDNVSRTVGCVDTHAWTHGPSGEIYVLTKDGLYVIAGSSAIPQPISQAVLPADLKDTNRDNFETTLVYDTQKDGLYIFVTPFNCDTAGTHYWYDFDTQSFWQLTFADNDHQPVSAVSFSSDPTVDRQVIIACNDGFLRRFDDSDDDDGTAIAASIILGPYRTNKDIDMEGIVSKAVGTMAVGSTDVTVELYVGDDAESVSDTAIAGTSPDYSWTWSAGRNDPEYPRSSGMAFCLKLKTTTGIWAYEGASVDVEPVGQQRL